jgi:hypothetical protein
MNVKDKMGQGRRDILPVQNDVDRATAEGYPIPAIFSRDGLHIKAF